MSLLRSLKSWRYTSISNDFGTPDAALANGYFRAANWQVGSHDNGFGASEMKMMREADGMEAIYDGDTNQLLVGPPYGGTRNLVTPLNLNSDLVVRYGSGPIAVAAAVGSWLGHAVADMVPDWITP